MSSIKKALKEKNMGNKKQNDPTILANIEFISERLKTFMDNYKVKPEDIATVLNLSPSQVGKYTNGSNSISAAYIKKIIDHYSLSADYFFTDTPGKPVDNCDLDDTYICKKFPRHSEKIFRKLSEALANAVETDPSIIFDLDNDSIKILGAHGGNSLTLPPENRH